MTKLTAGTALVGCPEKTLDSAIVKSFMQSWLAPTLARKLADEAGYRKKSSAKLTEEAWAWVLDPRWFGTHCSLELQDREQKRGSNG